MSNFSSFLEKHKDIAFIVYRDYDSENIRMQEIKNSRAIVKDDDFLPPVTHVNESIFAVSHDLYAAVTSVLESRTGFTDLLASFKDTSELPAPYLFMYHSRSGFDDVIFDLPEKCKRQMRFLSDYIQTEFGPEYAAVDLLLAQRRISIAYIKYLFKPNDILVHFKEGNFMAYVSKEWPPESYSHENSGMYASSVNNALSRHLKSSTVVNSSKNTPNEGKSKVWLWAFDGKFWRESTRIQLKIGGNDTSEKDIAELNVCPLQFVDEEITKILRKRGETFWKCRYRHLVSYQENAKEEIHKPVSDISTLSLLNH